MPNKKQKTNRPRKFNRDPAKHADCRRRWRRWLPRIVLDMTDILGKREIFWELQEIAKENPGILTPGEFFDWMCRNYMDAVTVGARRFTDQDKRSHSLWRMLYEILENPGVINRRAHNTLYRNTTSLIDLGNRSFDNLVGKDMEVLSQTQVRSDLQNLEVAGERIRRLVNKRVAHLTSPGAIRKLPTFNDLDKTLDTYDKILCKYNTLLTAAGMVSAFATRQGYWMDVLLKPWVGPESKFYNKLKA